MDEKKDIKSFNLKELKRRNGKIGEKSLGETDLSVVT